MSVVGDAAAGVLLSQLIYWTRRGVDVVERDGWIYKTAHEWQLETGMSWKVQRRARSILQARDVIEERKQRMPARLEYRLKLPTLVPLLARHADIPTEGLDLAHFRDVDNTLADALLGCAFLFHGALTRLFPLHASMVCSRLLVPARLATLTPQALLQAAWRMPGGMTRLSTLHRIDWLDQTGLSRDQWQTARRHLRAAGVLVERRHNFPRRVDLSVDLRALAALLRQPVAGPEDGALPAAAPAIAELASSEATGSGATLPAGLDRAKQGTGLGHRPNPLGQSTLAAHQDRPIQPLAIARSSLYLDGLQDGLHPQPQDAQAQAQAATPSPMQPSLATVWSGGCVYGAIKVEFRAPASIPALRTRNPAPTTQATLQTLVWPRLFEELDQAQAIRHLRGLDRATQQTVLDEIDWMRQAGREIRSPVALARTLANRARTGDFVADGAHRVLAARLLAQAEAQRRRDEAAKRQQEPRPCQPLSVELKAVRERLRQLTGDPKRRLA